MKRATVVIGANWGDEGKGLLVDYFASRITTDKVVVRFNGGSQSGHTVITPEDKRHVFSHFSAGTLAGAHTYLAKHFVCNPLMFWKEASTLRDLGHGSIIAADPRCYITTPYDMIINQMTEDARGEKRHGSVGMGFGETIARNFYPAFRLLKSDLADRDKVTIRLRTIRDNWMRARLSRFDIRSPPKTDSRMSDEMLERTVEALTAFNKSVVSAGAEFLERKQVIFEGGQGLALDMNSKNFPHVTRSNTGLTNVVPLAKALGLSLDVVYVSRTYLTKHGAGPFPGECKPEKAWIDTTNVEHPYQGALRYAPLNVEDMLTRIKEDAKQSPSAKWSVALTCCDQITPVTEARLIDLIGHVELRSLGPRRDHVTTKL